VRLGTCTAPSGLFGPSSRRFYTGGRRNNQISFGRSQALAKQIAARQVKWSFYTGGRRNNQISFGRSQALAKQIAARQVKWKN